MSYRLQAGRLTKSVILETPSAVTPDGDGNHTVTWTALTPSPVWASIEAISAAERLQSSSVQADATHLVELRYHSGVTTKTRIRFGARVLQVVSVENVDEADTVLRLRCQESKP